MEVPSFSEAVESLKSDIASGNPSQVNEMLTGPISLVEVQKPFVVIDDNGKLYRLQFDRWEGIFELLLTDNAWRMEYAACRRMRQRHEQGKQH